MVVDSSNDLRFKCVYGRGVIGSLKVDAGFEYDVWKKLKR
jgi:hypothetical protein